MGTCEVRLTSNPFFLSVVAELLSHVRLSATPWTAAHQAPLSVGFSRQEDWSGLPFPPPGDLPSQGSNPRLLHWQVRSLPLSHQGSLSILAVRRTNVCARQALGPANEKKSRPGRLDGTGEQPAQGKAPGQEAEAAILAPLAQLRVPESRTR